MEKNNILKKSFVYTFIIGIIAHGYCFANNIASHDALNNFYIANKWSKASFGRFFYVIYLSISRGRMLLPWLVGILGLLWCSLAVFLIVIMFNIKKETIICLVSAICITNPTVYSLAATYLHDFDADLFALFLSVAAVFLWQKAIYEKNNVKCYSLITIAGLILSVCLGVYQSYVSVSIVLIMIICIRNLLNEQDFFGILKQGIRGILMLGVSALCYACEIKVFTHFTGISIVENNSYNGLGNMSSLFSGDIVEKIIRSYKDFFEAFFNLNSAYSRKFYLLVHGILAIAIVGIIIYGLSRVEWKSKLLIILLGIVMPFGMNVSYVLSGGTIHDIMRYAFWLIYLFALICMLWLQNDKVTSDILKKVSSLVIIVCVSIVIIGNIQTSNIIYVKKELEYQSTLSYMTRVADCIEQNEEYVSGETPVYFVGENAIGKTRAGFEEYTDITGVSSTSPITFYDTYDKYFEYVLGLEITLSENVALEDDERVCEMPVFPKEGSVQMIDETLVVKLK